MKQRRSSLAAITLSILTGLVAVAVAQSPNAQQLAILRWYDSNTTADFTVTDTSSTTIAPAGVVFDGEYMWVLGSGKAVKMRPNDGAILASVAVGSGPLTGAYDGRRLWVANYTDGTVSYFDAANPASVSTVDLNSGGTAHPEGVAFDGTNIWVADDGSGRLAKIPVASVSSWSWKYSPGVPLDSVVFDGGHLWVSTDASSGPVVELAGDGLTCVHSWAVTQPAALTFDGHSAWVGEDNSSYLDKLDPSNCSGCAAVPSNRCTPDARVFLNQDHPRGTAFDGFFVWVANTASNTVSKVRVSDHALIGSYAVGSNPRGVAFDGANIWIANSGGTTVSKR